MRDSAPIAIFDSGLGGLAVAREVRRLLPGESILYLADQAHLPYGPCPLETVRSYAFGVADFFRKRGAKVIVLACHTASAAALHELRACFPETPFVGMEPAVKPAAEASRAGRVGVVATEATFQGALFRSVVERFAAGVEVRNATCPGLVEAIEDLLAEEGAAAEGKENESILRARAKVEETIRRAVKPLSEAGIDRLVLGCTHYPLVRLLFERAVGPGVEVVDPSAAVARQVGRILAAQAETTDGGDGEEERKGKGGGGGAKQARPRSEAHAPPLVPYFFALTTAADTDRFAQQIRAVLGEGAGIGRAVWDGTALRIRE